MSASGGGLQGDPCSRGFRVGGRGCASCARGTSVPFRPRDGLRVLRPCFERLTEWAGDDVPAAVLVFAGDLPRCDDPLPRFLDDGGRRSCCKPPAPPRSIHPPRGGVPGPHRAAQGEFCDLSIDSVVQIGSAYWLHVPVGQLRTDRYIPLHPSSRTCSTTGVAHRPTGLREPYLFHRTLRITTARVRPGLGQRGGQIFAARAQLSLRGPRDGSLPGPK